MLSISVPSHLHLIQANVTAAARDGTTVTASATPHAVGAWTSLVDPVDEAIGALAVMISGVRQSATATEMLVDIATGPTGGGSEAIIIANLDAGAAQDGNTGEGKMWYFPVSIGKGVRVSARARALIADDTCEIVVILYQQSHHSKMQNVIAYGAVEASSRGTLVAPAIDAFGSWVELGTTSQGHTYWSIGYDLAGDTAVLQSRPLIQLGTGPDASNVSPIALFLANDGAGEQVGHAFVPIHAPVLNGTKVWARIADNETDNRGVIAYGM